MTPKAMRYVLLAAVVVVWSLILYKVLRAVDNDAPLPATNNKSIKTITSSQEDTFSLLANYNDPFLAPDMMYADDMVFPQSKGEVDTAPRKTPPPPEVIDISFIRYIGMIQNTTRKVKAAVLIIRGKEILMTEGQTAENITVLNISKSGITIRYKNKKMIISRIN